MNLRIIILGIVLLYTILTSCKNDDVAPIAYKIKSITIENFSATNNGNNWDILDAPDIYIELWYDSGSVYESDRHTNADAGTDHTFNPNYRIATEKISGEFQIRLYDYDIATNDQLMESYSFTLNGQEVQSFEEGDFAFIIEVEALLE